MGGQNKFARVYLLEDINDNRYIGSTSELKLDTRLHTHRRDKKEYQLERRKNCCSSMKLDLYHCAIIELMVVQNNKAERSYWEKHYINNVFPECLNTTRYDYDLDDYHKDYYLKNKTKLNEQVKQYRKKNREAYNKTRREYYHNNKEAITKQRAILREHKRLANL